MRPITTPTSQSTYMCTRSLVFVLRRPVTAAHDVNSRDMELRLLRLAGWRRVFQLSSCGYGKFYVVLRP